MLPAAERYVVRVAEAVAAGGLTTFDGPPDPGFDLPLLLHLATAHHLRCAVTDALLAHPESVSASAVVAGLSLEDVKAGRLGLAAQWLSGLSRARRAQALLAGHGIRSVLAPSAAVALMTAGRTPIDPHVVSLMVDASALEAARALISRDDPRAAIVFEEATADVLADAAGAPGVVRLAACRRSRTRNERCARPRRRATPTLEALVALAALTGELSTTRRARLLLSAAAATRPQRQPVARSDVAPVDLGGGISLALRRRRHRARSPHRPASLARRRRPSRADVQRRSGDAAERCRSRLCGSRVSAIACLPTGRW